MRLGIDVGSRWIVAAVADRGNYPLVAFVGEDAVPRKYFPPLIAVQDAKRVYGWDAWSAQSDTQVVLPRRGPGAEFWVSSSTPELLAEIASALHNALDNAHLNRAESEQYEVALGVPVQSAPSERARIAEAFRGGEFNVLDLIEEPLADALEFKRTHSQYGSIMVCHLGARLSAAAVIEWKGNSPRILGSAPLDVTADSFDAMLAELALQEATGLERLSDEALFSLAEECRCQRESLRAWAQRLVLDLGSIVGSGKVISISMETVRAEWQPQLDRTIQAIERLLKEFKGTVAAIYATGEGSELPFVVPTLKEVFGEQVCRAANGGATTAVGLAIAAEQIDDVRSEMKRPSPNMPEDAPAPTTSVDPEHWLAGFVRDITTEYDALGGTITFDRVSELLSQHRRTYLNEIETTRRMVRAYPELFKDR